MKALYQKTFDTVRLSDARTDAIRAQLAAAGKTEVIPMKKHVSLRRPLVLAAILVLAFALSITAFAYGMRRFDLMTGGVIREGVDDGFAAYHLDSQVLFFQFAFASDYYKERLYAYTAMDPVTNWDTIIDTLCGMAEKMLKK